MSPASEDPDFLGVAPETVRALGELVLVAGRLEGILRRIAGALATEVGSRDSFKNVRRAALGRLKTDGVPPWATVTAPEVEKWLQQLPGPMKRRDEILHSFPMQRMTDDGLESIAAAIRDGTAVEVTTGSVTRLREEVGVLGNRGLRVYGGLLAFVPGSEIGGLDVLGPYEVPGRLPGHSLSDAQKEEIKAFRQRVRAVWSPWPTSDRPGS